MFTDRLAEMRAYGEGFIIADQIPTKLAPETLKNTNLKIVHRLVAPDDRDVAGSCMNLNDWQTRHLNNLPPGIAIVHDERIGEAVQTNITLVKDLGALAGGAEETERTPAVTASENTASEKLYLYRHAGCRSCPSPCDFYHRLPEAGVDAEISRELQPFLESLFVDDIERVWEKWSLWRAQWQAGRRRPLKTKKDEENGITYCAITQASYNWLGELLAARNKVLSQEGTLGPQDRLRREKVRSHK